MIDLSKVQYYTGANAFKNNRVYTGSVTISGSTTAGVNLKQSTITLARAPDLLDVTFNGPTDASDPRPADGWFSKGAVYAPGTDVPSGYTNYPTSWVVYTSINGLTMTISFIFSQQFLATLALTPIVVQYKVVDYSVF